MIVTARHNDLLSIGKLCELLQIMPRDVERLALRLSLAPSMRLNLVGYYSADQVDAIRQLLTAERASKPAGVSK